MFGWLLCKVTNIMDIIHRVRLIFSVQTFSANIMAVEKSRRSRCVSTAGDRPLDSPQGSEGVCYDALNWKQKENKCLLVKMRRHKRRRHQHKGGGCALRCLDVEEQDNVKSQLTLNLFFLLIGLEILRLLDSSMCIELLNNINCYKTHAKVGHRFYDAQSYG